MFGNGLRVLRSNRRVSRWVLFFVFLVSMLLVFVQPAHAQITRNTVGPDGAFATIQNAIWSCPNSGECHVDVQAGQTYTENVVFMAAHTGGKIVMTGGWDSTFSSREEGHRLSTIDGGGTGRVLNIEVGGTHTLEIEGFIIENGSSNSGAGIRVYPSGQSGAVVKLTNLDIRNNHASGHDSNGGGVEASLDGSERLEIDRCEIQQNSVTTTSGTNWAMAGGMMIAAYGSASFLVEDTWIEHNTATSDTAQKEGVGQFFTLENDASGEIINLRVTNNAAGGTLAAVTGTGGYLGLFDNSSIVVRRCVWALNENTTGSTGGDQLVISSNGTSTLLVTDSAVVLGGQDGLRSSAWDTAEQGFVNLTAADNTLIGIRMDVVGVGATASLHNSIVYGNGTNTMLDAEVDTGNNLIGVDPVWVSPGAPNFNYHLDQGSPALDAGNNAPPGGLGPLDLDGLPRIQNSIVDIGCYEGAGLLFVDGFEAGGTGEWSEVVP